MRKDQKREKSQVESSLKENWSMVKSSGIQLSVVKPKRKQSFWPITADADNPTNQSEREANACRWRQARENACEQVTISFGFTSYLSRKLWEIF